MGRVASIVTRFGLVEERAALEALQWRASLAWEEQRAELLAHPDAIQLPVSQFEEKRVRVAIEDSRADGFAVTIPKSAGASELDGLFVEPDRWGRGIGRALIADAFAVARSQGARTLEVIANPLARGFYERCGFMEFGTADTRFGTAIAMRITLPAGRPGAQRVRKARA